MTSPTGGFIQLKPWGWDPPAGGTEPPAAARSGKQSAACWSTSTTFIIVIVTNNILINEGHTMKVTSIDCRRLRRLIRKERSSGGGADGGLLLVDCRPQLSFRGSNVRGSVNAHPNPLLVRRSRGARGPLPPRLVLSDERTLRRLREGRVSAVVALDEHTAHWRQLRADSVARAVVESLSGVARGATICFLKGRRSDVITIFICVVLVAVFVVLLLLLCCCCCCVFTLVVVLLLLLCCCCSCWWWWWWCWCCCSCYLVICSCASAGE